MAMWVMAVVGAAPCQCFSPGGNQTTSPGWISSMGPPWRCARPQPAVTISVRPSGWVCHAVRAPGSNVTVAPLTRAGSLPLNGESMRTLPVNQSAGFDLWYMPLLTELEIGLCLISTKIPHLTVLKAFVC